MSLPTAIAVAQHSPHEIASSVTLGGEHESDATLYLRFPAGSADRALLLAWLVLDLRESTRSSEPVTLEIGRARGPFSSGGLRPTEQPGLTPPLVEYRIESGATGPLRVNVTELVQYFERHAQRAPILAIRARNTRGAGVTLSTGVDGGRAPRLDAYWR
ncbi:MAG TPA: hypothetical protein VFQ61_20835 [Polyangiaceae bacterium]|nr:hypothetical protein [Polyangiaceae bacterium]